MIDFLRVTSLHGVPLFFSLTEALRNEGSARLRVLEFFLIQGKIVTGRTPVLFFTCTKALSGRMPISFFFRFLTGACGFPSFLWSRVDDR